jgi:hypothetical protein
VKEANHELLNRLRVIAKARNEHLTVQKFAMNNWRVGFGTERLAVGRTLREAALAALREEVLRRHGGKEQVNAALEEMDQW